MRTLIACLASPLLVLATACSGDDSGNNDTAATIAMTMAVTTAPGDDGVTGTAGDDGMSDTAGTDDDVDTAGDTPVTGDSDTTPDGSDDTPLPTPACQHQCTVPEDCFVDTMETGLGCNSGTCSIICTTDMECINASSGWTLVPCTGDGDCSGGACVDTGGGVGGCALQPSQGPCSDAGLVDMMATAIGGGMITVCGQPDAICTSFAGLNICIVSCAGNACGGELTCEADGLCHCEFDTQCVDTGLGNNCNADGLCEFSCQAATDCPPHPFDGGMIVCE